MWPLVFCFCGSSQLDDLSKIKCWFQKTWIEVFDFEFFTRPCFDILNCFELFVDLSSIFPCKYSCLKRVDSMTRVKPQALNCLYRVISTWIPFYDLQIEVRIANTVPETNSKTPLKMNGWITKRMKLEFTIKKKKLRLRKKFLPDFHLFINSRRSYFLKMKQYDSRIFQQQVISREGPRHVQHQSLCFEKGIMIWLSQVIGLPKCCRWFFCF